MLWMVSMYKSSMVFLVMSSMSCLLEALYCLKSGQAYCIEWELMSLNSSSIVMTFFLFLISSMVLYYSGEYMAGENNMNRYMYLVSAFVMSMSFLLISSNLVSILLGCDGLGPVS